MLGDAEGPAAALAGLAAAAVAAGGVVPGLLLTEGNATATNPDVLNAGERYISLISLAVFLVSAILVAYVTPHLGTSRGSMRQVGFIVLHLADYLTNLLMMVVVYLSHNTIWLAVLVPVHIAIGAFCVKSAVEKTEWRSWGGNTFCNLFFVIVVLGLMQGIQVKLAYDDFLQSLEEARVAAEEVDEETASRIMSASRNAPAMMPARFHCKAVEGLIEATVFAFVALYLLLEKGLISPYTGHLVVALTNWQSSVLYFSAVIACVSTGLALMEIDHKTSVAVQQELATGLTPLRKVRHLCFRTAEFMLRILTLLLFIILTQAVQLTVWVPVVAIFIDYLVCVFLVYWFGGKDAGKYNVRSLFTLGVPLVVVNLVQFLDAPGLSLRARRISSILVPLRLLELAGIVVACFTVPSKVIMPSSDGTTKNEKTFLDFLMLHKQWDIYWLISAFVYLFFLLTYACRLKPGADLHSAVADGDLATLDKLLHQDDLVLDLNRYGPDGRTPLHLAARRGYVDCMKMLFKEGADLNLRTANRMKNTALHLATMSKSPGAVQCLCMMSNSEGKFLNATNNQGDTALHLAAELQNVEMLQELLQQPGIDVKKKNNRGKTPLECVGSDKFGFDRNSSENAATELLRRAEFGEDLVTTTPSSKPSGGTEMTSYDNSKDSANSLQPSGARLGGGLRAVPEGVEMDGSMSGAAVEGVISVAPDPMRQDVPLIHIKSVQERQFLMKHNNLGKNGAGIQTAANLTTCGLAPFVLSAGLGALGFLNLPEEAEQQIVNGQQGQSKEVSLDDFEEIKPLGEGAFGKVVLVKLRTTGEQFAMKTMDKAKFKAQKISHKVISEQYILKTTRHPFIVGLHYAFQGSKFWALVMDLCPNGDLMKLLVDYGSPGLNIQEIARYCGEVLLAIEHLHGIKVIFRDLKLDNVVIDTLWRARVTDFGLAKKLETEADAKTMCGSYGYAAPEIMTGKGKQYTYAVDLYSFGIMFYMMLSGGTPSTRNPNQRNPPMKHADFKIKVREAEKNPNTEWSRPENHAMDLINRLTSQDPETRGTVATARQHKYFTHHLGRTVKDLLSDPGPYWPPGGGPQPGLVAGTAAAIALTSGQV